MEKSKALARAAALCSRSEQCEADVHTKLSRWLDDPDAIHDIITRLKEEGFIDDLRYARAYVHDKFLYNGWGRIKLRAMLRAKGIDSEAIDNALIQIDDNEYAQMLHRLLTNKLNSIKHADARHTRAALLRFAASRGFESGMCYSITNSIIGNHEGDDY